MVLRSGEVRVYADSLLNFKPTGDFPGRVSLKIYNMLGQEVATLIDRDMTAGTHNVVFDAARLPSGVYLYRLRSGSFAEVKRMAL